MGNDQELSIIVRARNEASKIIKQVQDDSRGAGAAIKKGFEDAVPASQALAVGVAAAGAAVVGFGIMSVKAYAEAEQASAQLDAVLQSTGNAAGITKDQLLDQATALQAVTKFSDEAVQATQAMLLTFTNIKGGVMQDATKTALDMAQALGMDGAQAAMQLGKALNDPLEGLTKLTRVGVTFSKAQEDQVKALVAAGDAAGAQKIILAELNKEFGGSAAAAGATYAGQLEILKNTFGDLQETVGKFILDAIKPLMSAFSGWLASVSEAGGLFDYFKGKIEENKDMLIVMGTAIAVGLVPALAAAAVAAWSFIAPLIPFLAIGAALGLAVNYLVEQFGGWGKVMDWVGGVIDNVKLGWEVFVSAFKDPDITSDGWVGTIEEIAGVARQLFDFFLDTGRKAIDGIKMAFDFLWPSIKSLGDTIANELWPALMNLWNILSPILLPALQIIGAIIGVVIVAAIWLFVNVLRIVIGIISALINFIAGLIQAIVGLVTWVIQAGAAIGKAFADAWNWIVATWNNVGGWFRGKWNEIVSIFSGVGQFFGDMFRNAWNGITGIFNQLGGFFRGVWGSIMGIFSGIGNAVANAIGGGVKGVINSVIGLAEGAVNGFIDMINGAINVINKIPGVSIGKVGRLGLPRLATGTDNFAGGWATVGEQGRENVWLPKGSQVFSQKDSKSMGGEVTNNFYGEMHFDSAEAVDRFYNRINRDSELAQMGMPT
jgi:phage-related protein